MTNKSSAQELKNSLDKYVRDYRIHLHKIREFYIGLKPELAIENAAAGMASHNKMDSHQFRLGKKKGRVAATELLKHLVDLEKCKTFREIFEITENVKNEVHGLGDLWSYDTALRIGFNKNLYPEEVYIQRGVVRGIKKIFGKNMPKGRCLTLSIFPIEVQSLRPYEVENFMCIWGKASFKSC